ncbi:MAG: hydroxymethylglutaryl-CoA reductase [Flavobacteriales bacterium]|nr:hydroxymethylglutaryl-CoA reductase [Flavobacteriales bacterium]
MSITKEKLNKVVEAVAKNNVFERIENFDEEHTKSLPGVSFKNPYTKEGQEDRLNFIQTATGKELPLLSGQEQFTDNEKLKGNIENYIGMTQIPTGIMGPLVMNGMHATGAFYIPLATSEGALVASYARGAKACKDSGAIRSVCLMEGVQRCPVFKFDNLLSVGKFVVWLMEQKDEFTKITSASSNYAELSDMELNIEGNEVTLTLEYTTGDAAGQNMVTICTQAICQYIISQTPIQPEIWFIEGNMSGDKKATSNSFASVRGKNVTAEITLKRQVVIDVLKTSPELMFEYWKTSFMGAVKAGSIGAQGHFANGLAALFIACGQDAACVSEASVGVTRMEVTTEGDLYTTVTLPNLIVGTVGGGTGLPTQRECLELIDCYGAGHAKKFAEICAGVCLSGELSIVAAMSAGHFASAHAKLGRK